MNRTIENIIKINTESSSLLASILDSHRYKKFKAFSMPFYSLNILRRIVFYQRSINPLLKELEVNIAYEFPIAILLRSACMDILQYGYMMQILDNLPWEEANEDVIQDVIRPKIVDTLQSIYCDNLKNQVWDWEALKDVGELSQAELDLLVNHLSEEYYSFYPGEDPKNCKSLTSRDIYRKLKQSKKYDLYSNLFYYYSYFSKLEHFGILSFEFTKSNENKRPELYQKIKHIVSSFLEVIQIGLIFLGIEVSETKRFDEWIDELIK